MIRPVTVDDAVRICEIYNPYALQTIVTFEESPVAPDEMRERIRKTLQGFPWLVCEENGTLQGFSYASKWKGRCAYRYAAESTIYLRAEAIGKGFGSLLYGALLAELRQQGMHTVIGGIALPNDASVALHERFGFRKVAHFKEVGRKFGEWIDVGYWQLLL